MESDVNGNIYVRVDRTRKLPVTVLIRALGYSTDSTILDLFDNNQYIQNTLDKDNTHSEDDALLRFTSGLGPVSLQLSIVQKLF